MNYLDQLFPAWRETFLTHMVSGTIGSEGRRKTAAFAPSFHKIAHNVPENEYDCSL